MGIRVLALRTIRMAKMLRQREVHVHSGLLRYVVDRAGCLSLDPAEAASSGTGDPQLPMALGTEELDQGVIKTGALEEDASLSSNEAIC